jgi:hypothetical protein
MKIRGHNSQLPLYEIRTRLVCQSNVTGVHVNELCQSLSLFLLEEERVILCLWGMDLLALFSSLSYVEI